MLKSDIPTGTPQTESPSQMAKKCLKIIEKYQTGTWTPLSKVMAIQGITSLLTSGAGELSETEVNDTLGLYLRILKQHDKSIDICYESAKIVN